jgi:lysylphosphatidylglycerol synthetase-like protein (DUF2156 family)
VSAIVESVLRKLALVFDATWLPLLLLAGTIWLYAPWLHHAHVGHLQVISEYEGSGQMWAWLLRAGDALAAVIVIMAVLRARLLHVSRLLGLALIAVAALSIVDITFTIGCYHGCTSWQIACRQIHDINSTFSLIVLAGATAWDAFKNKSWLSRAFLAAQIVTGIVLLLTDKQIMIFAQYIYESCLIVWLAYVLRRYLPHGPLKIPETYIRWLFAVLLFIAGCLELMFAFHVRAYGHIPGVLGHSEPLWLAQYSVLTGATMLYLARQLYRGERRAAIIVGVVLISLVIKYALVSPEIYALALSELSLVILYVYWPAFNRNIGVPPLLARLRSVGLLLAGIVIALALLVAGAKLSGRLPALAGDADHLFDSSTATLHIQPERLIEHRILHLQYISASVVVMVVIFLLWSLFQPSHDLSQRAFMRREDIKRLLKQYANSSEDFFKLWPEDKSYFRVPDIDGFIAYKKVGSTIFALADPICAAADSQQLLTAFTAECRRRGWWVCFLLVSETSKQHYTQRGLKTIQVGSSAVIPIAAFSETTMHDKWWRWQLNRAKKAGLRYEISSPPHAISLLAETKVLSDRWLQRAGHTEQGFALGYYDMDYLKGCQLHLLRDAEGQLVAFTNQLPTYNRLPQTTVDLIRFEPEVNGAMPTLIAHVIAGLAHTDYKTFDLGFVPLAKLDSPLANVARLLTVGRFSAAGLEQFKGKFKPDWQPQYLAYDGDLIDLTALITRLEKAMRVQR